MFYVGQKVVCVDDSLEKGQSHTGLVTGAIYTVSKVLPWSDRYGTYGVYVEEARAIATAHFSDSFRHNRFRPIVERKTDISCFTDMLKPADERVTA